MRANNLCFKCGEKYGPTHICKEKEVHILLVDESEVGDKGLLEGLEEEIIEYQGW